MFLQKTIRNLIHKYIPYHKHTTVAEEILYPREVFPIYCDVQNNFKFCMHNRLLSRNEILEFKAMLNDSINLKLYRHQKYQNDAHEIYSKLKDKRISRKRMLLFNEFLTPYLIEIPEPITVRENLRVIK